MVLAEVEGFRGLVYMDDIIKYGKTFQEYNKRLENIFKDLRKYNLKL